jgi:hypothetical protein
MNEGAAMRFLVALGAGLLLPATVAADEVKKPETVLEEMMEQIKELTTILEGIKNEDSAKAAIPRLEKSAKKIGALGKTMKAFKLSTVEDNALKKKYETQLQVILKKMTAAAIDAGARAPDQAKQITAALQKVK